MNEISPTRLDGLLARVQALRPPQATGASDPVQRSVRHRRISMAPWTIEDRDARLARRQRWLARVVARAYDVAWVPDTVAVNIQCVDFDVASGAVILVLKSGTRLIDRQDRIDIVGTVDDVTTDELVEAIRRRGWDAVEVDGPPDFRRAVSRRLAVLSPPVVMVADPLSDSDLADIKKTIPLAFSMVCANQAPP